MKPQKSCKIYYTKSLNPINVFLPASKSESNRILILNALSENVSPIGNLSEARDTKTMHRLLQNDNPELDVHDAGTTMRFLTAYHAISHKQCKITGSARMCERPIGVLVTALNELGADIEYLKKRGYPPLFVKSFKGQKTSKLVVRGDISSQYISALLMIAPKLPEGLKIELTGKVMSRPYITMTLSLMEAFGVTTNWIGNVIEIPHQEYKSQPYEIESDWSGASYWYGFVALAQYAEVKLLGLKKNSLQGDINIVNVMNDLGVLTSFTQDGVLLKKSDHKKSITIDFSTCPDLAQTIAVVCAAKNIECTMTGLESLRIKETDRISALQIELAKIGAELVENNNHWKLIPANSLNLTNTPTFSTYEDHRMAMAFAPLATINDIIIENPDVVQKSYPNFWKDVKKAGFSIDKL